MHFWNFSAVFLNINLLINHFKPPLPPLLKVGLVAEVNDTGHNCCIGKSNIINQIKFEKSLWKTPFENL